MSTSRRIRRVDSNALRGILSNGMFTLLLVSMPFESGTIDVASAPPPITCVVRAPRVVEPGQPVMLTVELHNRSPVAVAVLNWGTPFEDAWLQPFVDVQRDGRPLSYGGASVKRGDPERDEYVRLAPGQRRIARLDMAEVFDFGAPGRYSITPRLHLHDVAVLPTPLPRPRERHTPQTLACGAAVETLVRPAQTIPSP